MASQETLVPQSIADFDAYIRKTNTYLISGSPINAIRFNWTNVELITWQDFLVEWMPLYAQYKDNKEEFTSLVKDQLMTIIAACEALCKHNNLIKNIEAIPSQRMEDLLTFNLPQKNTGAATL